MRSLVRSPNKHIGNLSSQAMARDVGGLLSLGNARLVAILLFGLAAQSLAAPASALKPAYLRCEYRVDPIGMDQSHPRLSWIVESSGVQRARVQSAYQVQVASSLEKLNRNLGDVWDSGKQKSDESAQVIYAGAPLQSASEYFWRVKLWDEQNAPSGWSADARWTTGLQRADWGAQWISDPDIRVSPEVEGESLRGVNSGYMAGSSRDPDTVKWVGVDLGASFPVDGVRLYPADAFNYQEGAPAYYFPVRYRVEVANLPDFSDAAIVLDHTDHNQPTPPLKVEPPLERFAVRHARYVRVLVTRLLQENELFSSFALAEFKVYSGGENVALGKAALALDSAAGPGWSKAYLVDGRTEPIRMGTVQQPATLLRKSFSVGSAPRRALLYVTARGLYEIHVNGERVGDHLLAPEWTVYDKRSQYQAYDVTSYVRAGENVLAAHLAAGWYSGKVGLVPTRRAYGEVPQLLVHLELQNQDGQKQVVASDGSWRRFSDGPIRSADIYDGETYDARKEVRGWDRPGYDDTSWKAAQVTTDKNAVELSWQRNDAIRAAQEVRPVSIRQSHPGVYIFDLGQNMVGWVRLKVNGPAGTALKVRHAEALDDNGEMYTANLREAWQIDRYILSGAGQEVFEPHFTYHGFRYVEVSGLPEPPTKETVTGIVFYSSAPSVGEFSTSSEFVNRLMRNILWTQHGNMMGILTDCPQRPERLGWTGDLQIFAQASIYSMDMENFYEKFLRDLRDDQLPNGRFPDVTPNPMRVAAQLTNFFQGDALYGSPAWADAGLIAPWALYIHYGDKQLLAEHYAAARAWVDYVWSKNPDFLWKNQRGLDAGDWLNGDTVFGGDDWPRHEAAVPLEVVSTQFFAHSADLMSRIAEALGNKEDAQKYRELFDSIRSAFVRAYVSGDGKIQGDTQAGYALALHFNLLPDALRPAAVGHLLHAIARYNGGHLSTGIQSTNRLMLELSRSGNNAEAYRLLLAHGLPSWGAALDNGATTVWERWDGYIAPRGFQFQPMNSFNHVAFGSVAQWMWQTIVGLVPDERSPGYKRFIVRPMPGGGLTSAHGKYNSVHGPIDIQWEIKDREFLLNLTVPTNTSADVYLPAHAVDQVTEGGVAIAQVPGVSGARVAGDSVLVQVGSGEYRFKVTP